MTTRRTAALLLAAATAICGNATATQAQAVTKYFARQVLVPAKPVYKGTWTYAGIKNYGACDGVTKIRPIEYSFTCNGGQCDPATMPQTRYDTTCRVQSCSGLSYYQKIATGSSPVTETRTFPVGTANPAEAVRAWCADLSVVTPVCEMEVTSTGFVGRAYAKFTPIFSDGGPNFATGMCNP